MGAMGTVVYGTWQLLYTLPRSQTLIIDEIAAHNGDVAVIIGSYTTLIIVNLAHAVCFFILISSLGSTTTGIMKGAQSVLVFIVSHFAFCAYQQSQCFTPAKGLSLVTVVFGVFLYSTFQLPKEENPVDGNDTTDDVDEVIVEYSRVPTKGYDDSKIKPTVFYYQTNRPQVAGNSDL
jgi:hypothetical protein